MTTILAFIGAIALLVVFHEFGHYWVARRCGVKVLRFSIGFGKVLYRKRFGAGETEWVVSAIPLGGYVKMLDEREGEVAAHELSRTFNRQPVRNRIAIVAAGPLANFLLAILLYWIMFVHGVPGLKPVLGEITPASPAASAMLQEGETIISVNGEPVPSWQELRWALLDLALKGVDATLIGRSAQGEMLSHQLASSQLKADDMDGDFTAKLGLKPYQPLMLPVIGELAEGGVAQQSGLQVGDLVLRADGVAVQRWSELVEVVRQHPELPIHFDIQRGGVTTSLQLTPKGVDESGVRVGKIGAGPKVDKEAWQALLTEVSYGAGDALRQALRKTWETSVVSLKMMGKMVMGEVSMKNLSGPITIADYAGQSAAMGVAAYLGFLALISISLGVLNLLPIPLLDGGHLLYYVAELVKGSPVSEQAWDIGQRIGIALLGTLMVFAMFNDINRLISS
ncbi:MAG: RIP metalloprotease RseP [Gallionella sp.]|nr:RIP metalloprotease RseP [Gallionella sp.]